ncbi:MAG TPA: SbcC/MukB-like Walker B domain-containing protein [Chloroflexota bacterium]|nr:SbcC/MukB-like Walker B domain-containing protein [Chloroflexota bacterium]
MDAIARNGTVQDQLFAFDSDALVGAGLDWLAARLDRSLTGPAGYVLHRLLLVNYWHFDYEELFVPHGRLFLLGENGSGKSTVLGATLPLLLDGVIRPERLDTFGSTHRKIDYYVLGQRVGGAAGGRRTSYVALEFAWHDPSASDHGPAALAAPVAADGIPLPPFLTIGICFAGNADAQETVRAHRFVLTSGTRLGIDLPLKDRHGRVYDAAYFRSVIREHGVITDRQGEYRDLVARHLFGYHDARTLEHLVEVLLLLRKPGLSNELHTFADVYEYVKHALPPLPEEIAQNTTEAFERIDELRHQEARLQRQADACGRIHEADLALARARARQRALPAVGAAHDARRRHAEVAAKERALADAERTREQVQARHAQIEQDLDEVRRSLSDLEGSARAHEATELERSLQQAESEWHLVQQLLAERERTVADRRRDASVLATRRAGQERGWEDHHAAASRALTTLASRAAEGRWPDGEAVAADILADLQRRTLTDREPPSSLAEMLSSDLSPRIADRRRRIEELAEDVAAYERAVNAEEQAGLRHRLRKQEAASAERDVDQAEQASVRAWEDLNRCLGDVRAAILLAGLESEAGDALFAAAARRDRAGLGMALAALEHDVRAADDRANAEHQRVSQEIGQLEQTLVALDRELERFQSEPDLDPPRRPHRERARAALRAAGLDARPLYALVDFASALSDERRGQVERMLDDAGLLDALVVPDGDAVAADALLRTRGLADCRLSVDGAAPSDTLLGSVLVVDATVADAGWRSAAERVLRSVAFVEAHSIADAGSAQLRADGSWRHGLLGGYAGLDGPLGFIGAANRRERRQWEIDRRLGERGILQARLDTRVDERERLRQEQARRHDDLRAVQQAADAREIAAAEVRSQERRVALQRAREAEDEVAVEASRCAAERELLQGRLADRAVPLVGVALPGPSLVQTALRATDRMDGSCNAARAELGRLADLWGEYQADRARQAELDDLIRQDEASRDETRHRLAAAEAGVRRARERLESSDLRDFQRQLVAARERTHQLNAELLAQASQRGSLQAQVETLQQAVRDAADAAAAADVARAVALGALAAIVQVNPEVADEGPSESDDDVLALAERWCSVGSTSQEQLDRDADQARERRRALFDEERGHLVDYNLAIVEDNRDRVVAHLSGREEHALAELLRTIQQQIRDSQLLLNDEEERLFKDYLCDTGLSAIHQAVQGAEQLVWRINEILARTPLGRERYELKLEATADQHGLSAPLARHHALFRKDPAAVTDDERKVLFEAVRGAVAEAHRHAGQEGGIFADLLAEAFDYREWYTLHLYVTDPNGQRQRINSRTARARSGAQQLFALYVPLFAALAALYHAAEPWAPRLFAMDEAFDKVSEDNVDLLLGFLVDLGFQWIVASPRLSGAGRDVLPACADWQLSHDAIGQLAQAIPLIYCNGQLLEDGLALP